ncbi:hypothetical protein [Stygiolobus azoricus]|uniref:hypothetical protein n=1 Tax=Stygiolobus azoricus TaxID=41675 RepID=UPI0018C8A1F1|nr:hypothetical protein [Stygiolobus azoricus]
MCDYRLVKINRVIGKTENLVLLPREYFNKLSDDNYLEVLVNDNRESLHLSKSYYYYILSQLKKLALIEDNAISFKAIIPIVIHEKGIEFDNSIAYVDKDNKMLIFIDMKSSKYGCPECPVYMECVFGLRRIASSIGAKVGKIGDEGRYSKLPAKLWNTIVDEILHKYLKNLHNIKIPTLRDYPI